MRNNEMEAAEEEEMEELIYNCNDEEIDDDDREEEMTSRCGTIRRMRDDDFPLSRKVSSRYDTCIVYALDEDLTCGTYRVFAQWFQCHLIRHNFPGCLIIVGFSNRPNGFVANCGGGGGGGGADEDRIRKAATIDLGCDSAPIPYVRLNPNDQYAIFDFKRQMGGRTSVVILVALPVSMMTRLSCDAIILVHAEFTLRRNTTRIKELLYQLAREYLDDLYARVNCPTIDNYDGDDDDDDIVATLPSATVSTSRVIGFEQRCDNDIVDLKCGGDVAADDIATATDNVVTDYERYNNPPSQPPMVMSTETQHPTTSQWQPRSPLIEYADERWEDRFRDGTHVSIANLREDVPRGVMRDDDYDDDAAAAATTNRYYGRDNAVSRLYIRNHALLNDLKRMDVRLTNTHPVDLLPVVHGETVDAALP